jgi:spore coat protein U-like protein
VTDVTFGTYTGATKDVTMSIDYMCDKAASDVYIMLDTGPDPRLMLGPQPATSSTIGYQLYLPDKVTVWTNTVSKTAAYYMLNPVDKKINSAVVTGRVSAGTVPPFGPYVDSLQVRMQYKNSKGIQNLNAAPVRVTANLSTTCSVATTNLAFGTYDPLIVNNAGAGTDLDAQATITVTCSTATATVVWITPGTAGRTMTGPGNLSYELYSDDTRTVPWGATQTDAVQVSVPNGVATQVPVYGRVPRGQNVPVGAYSQTVTVTVNF